MVSSYHRFVALVVWICNIRVLANSCQVYPSEYAFQENSVGRAEKPSANCISYPNSLQHGVITENYKHCNGSTLRLADSDFGSQNFIRKHYYLWSPGEMDSQLMFIFETKVNFTSITLHYYSNGSSTLGLPRLRFFTVPKDFDIWDAPSASNRYVYINATLPGEEPKGIKSASINFDFNTTKILMFIPPIDFYFALSEVEFFGCYNSNSTSTTAFTTNTGHMHIDTENAMVSSNIIPGPVTDQSQNAVSPQEGIPQPDTYQNTTTTPYYDLDTTQLLGNISMPPTLSLIAFVLILVVTTLILIVVLSLLFRHKSRVQKLEIDSKFDEPYSTLNRGNKEQTQPQTQDTPTELYDQIQLSPSTGQSEPISNKESENINIGASLSQHMEVSMVNETKSELEKTNLEDFTYAVVDKTKKKHTHHKIPECVNVNVTVSEESDTEEKSKDQLSWRQENLQEMYAVVHKKPKNCEEHKTAPPVPSHTIESLYTAVQK